MARLRRHLTYANVMATVAVFVALGGSSYAVVQLDKNSVKARNIARNAVTSKKVKDRSLLEKDFKLGQLPKGANGQDGQGGTASQPEAWHAVGDAGEPTFQNSWVNSDAVNFHPASFYKDPFGVVHLRGLVTAGTSGTIFQLPVGYRPGKGSYFPATNTSGGPGEVQVSFAGLVGRNSFVSPSGSFSLEGITFRAEG